MIYIYLIQRYIIPSDLMTLDDWIIIHETGEDRNKLGKTVHNISTENPEGKGPLSCARNYMRA
jgi:hypothetical protein